MHTQTLTDTINRARAIITSRAALTSTAKTALTKTPSAEPLTKRQARTRADNVERAASLPPFTEVFAYDPFPAPAPRVLPVKRANLPALASVTDLEALGGERRLLELLHDLAGHACGVRAYACTPSQVTYHQSQELLAYVLKVTTKTVQRWTRTLERLRLIATRAHYGGSKRNARIDGLVIAVALKPNHRAHLHHDDLNHQWRNLDADRQNGKTAWAAMKWLMSESTPQKESKCLYILRNWAVTGSFTKPPLRTDSDMGTNTVQDVIYTLPLLGDLPPRDRPKWVSLCADALASGLNDHHSRKWYARLIWNALEAEQSGLPALQPLAAMLARLEADKHEWKELRRPAALLNARLQGAV